MPEYIPEFIPADTDLDQFTQDYLIAAEWLLDEEEDRWKIKGWSPEAIEEARKDCVRFQEENAADLAKYANKTGYSGGNDFWLTRNGHGAGYWDRDLGEVGDRLTKAAHRYGETDAYSGDDGLLYFM